MPRFDLPERTARRRWIPPLRDVPIRAKLALILVVPVAAVLALATVRLVDVGRGAYEASMVHSLTSLSADVSALTQDLHRERMAAATYLASPNAKPDAYNVAVRGTDERIATYRAARGDIDDVPAGVSERLDAIDDHLSTLNSTRQEVLDRRQMPMVEAVLRYGVILTDLASYGDALGQVSGEGRVADGLRAAAAFNRAKVATAEEEAVVFTALSSGRLGEEQFSAFVATLTSQQEALLAFSLAADATERELVESTVTGDAVVLADRVAADVTRSVGQASLIRAADASHAIGSVNDLMRWAQLRLESRLLDEAEQAFSDVLWQATVEGALVLLTLILAVALAVVLARSLSESLRRLREGALLVANHDLPDAVSRLRDVGNVGDGGVEEIVRQVRDPIRLTNRDEVGQVARAFNVVHKEAVRIAAEQAALRTSVSAMFLNLARRSQTLVDRMIGELDAIERGEEDPKRLAQLFELDHLATRMRRNDENLLVLAGADSTAPRREDALLVDALRASQSEVELYNRIEFGTVDTDISIAAHAVNDVVRLVAELLDNATRFSPPNTVVVADARRIRDYVLIQVEDRGLGLTDEQLDSLNARLSNPSEVDVAAFRLMGLAVVSRLASRYGIRVELRRNIEGGTVAQVTLPSSTVILPRTQGREPALTRSRQPLAVESGPAGRGWSTPSIPSTPSEPTAGRLSDPVSASSGTHSPIAGAFAGASAGFNAAAAAPSGGFGNSSAAPSGGFGNSSAAPSGGFGNTSAAPSAGFNAAAAAPSGGFGNSSAAPSAGFNAAAAAPSGGFGNAFAAPPTNTPRIVEVAAPPHVAERPVVEGGSLDATAAFRTIEPANPPAGSWSPGTNQWPAGASAGQAVAGTVPAGLPSGPVAGTGAGPTTGTGTGPMTGAAGGQTLPRREEGQEAPIFQEMEAVWFRAHGQDATAIFTMPDRVPPATADPAHGGRTGAADATGGQNATPGRPPLPGRVPTGVTPPAPYSPPATAPATSSAPNVPVSPPPAPYQPPATAPEQAGSGISPAAAPAAAAPAAGTGPGGAGWRTAADEGWVRASQAAEPATAGTTRSGLPKRMPQAQLVPGGVAAKTSGDRARRTPDEVRGLLSAYHRGVQRGRSAGGAPNSTTSTKETSG